MAQNLLLKAKGLSVHSNPLGAVQEGSMQEALNVVIDRNEVVEPRRGFFEYGSSFGVAADRTKQLFTYKDIVLRHVLNNLQYDSDNNGLFTNFNDLNSNVSEISSGLRIKSIEANGNFYFVSSLGVRKITARNSTDLLTAAISLAGGIKALNLFAKADFSNPGFLSPNSKVAYRIVFGIKDLNENLILGSPSAREVVYNATTSASIVELTFPLPDDATSTSVFYQVYRTPVITAVSPNEPGDPGEEFNLVFEDNITSAQLIAGEVTVSDITPEDFRKSGTLLYTNPVSGDGIEQANEKPPFGTDIATYKGYTFLSNTKTVQRLNLAVLSIQNMVSNSSTISVVSGVTTNTYTFQGTHETFTVNFTNTDHADFVNGSANPAKYFKLISDSNLRKYAFYYVETPFDEKPVLSGYILVPIAILPGDTVPNIVTKTRTAILNETDDFNVTISMSGFVLTAACSNNGYVNVLTADLPLWTIDDIDFSVIKDNLGTGEDLVNNKIFLPKVPTGAENGPTTAQQLEQVTKSIEKVINAKDTLVYAYYLSTFNDVPGQFLLENRNIVGGAFSIISNVGSQFNPNLPLNTSSGNQVTSNNEVRPNRVYFSKFQQPEAFPIANYIDIGPKDREIKRIIALRDSLFIFKEDGIYRLSGDVAPFTVAPFDFSAQVLAADSAVVLNNQIYALSTQGVVVVTDTGVSVISRPIENLLLKVLKQGNSYKTITFGVSYESDRSYLLWMPTTVNDTTATQAFRYNTFTNTWTRWNNSKTCGLVNFADDKMYLGAGDANFIEKERKTLTRTDHADREYNLQIPLNGVNSNIINLNLTDEVSIGDVLLQTQYLTSSQFDRLLLKLDTDITVGFNDYYSLLKYIPGKNLRTSLQNLTSKLDLDSGLNFTNYSTLILSQSATISNIQPVGLQTIITTTLPHNLVAGRIILINGTNSNPITDGEYEVLSTPSPTTFVINKTIGFTGNTGVLQTQIQDFKDIQTCFNLVVNQLNNDSGAFYSNYDNSENSSEFEAVITSFNRSNNTVTVIQNLPLMAGDIKLYKAIKTSVIYNPIFFGDPSVEKQIREGTMMFENTNFSKVTLSYATDAAPSFEDTDFNGLGNGDWGQFNWGGINWGGVGAPIPIRTYIPLEKQRCRFMNVKFTHMVAFEKYAIFGLSLSFRPYGTRSYK